MSTDLSAAGTDGRISIGWIVSRTFSVLRRRVVDIGGLTLILVCAPEVLFDFLPGATSASGAVSAVLGAFYSGAMALIAYDELIGDGRIGGRAAFTAAAGRFGIIFGASLLSGLATLGGFLLLIVPGLFLMTAWMPLAPVAVIERLGVTASLGRAWQLSRGCRWSLGALLAIYLVCSMLTLGGLVFAAGATVDASQSSALERIVPVVLGVLASAIVYSIGAVGVAVVYVALRHAKDGAPAEIANVFA